MQGHIKTREPQDTITWGNNNQNPRCTQKLCIPLCLHTIFGPDYYVTHDIWSWLLCLHTVVGPDYYVYTPYFGPDYYVYTPYLVLITMFTHHIWSWLLCLYTRDSRTTLRRASTRRLITPHLAYFRNLHQAKRVHQPVEYQKQHLRVSVRGGNGRSKNQNG